MAQKLRNLILLLLFLSSFPLTAQATDWCAEASCVACWVMEADEDPIADESTNSNTAALKGAGEPNWATASPPVGSSTGYFDWDGDDYATVSNDASLDISDNQLTIVHWIYPDSNHDGGLIARRGGDDSVDYHTVVRGTGEFDFFFRKGGEGWSWHSADTAISTVAWTHRAVTYDGSNVRFYLDGVADGAPAETDDLDVSDDIILLGKSKTTGTWPYSGLMDDAAVFNEVHDSTEINDIMDNGLQPAAAPSAFIPKIMMF